MYIGIIYIYIYSYILVPWVGFVDFQLSLKVIHHGLSARLGPFVHRDWVPETMRARRLLASRAGWCLGRCFSPFSWE